MTIQQIAVLGVLVAGISSCSSPAPGLDLSVRTSDGALVVTNNEGIAASDCLVQINSQFELKGISLQPYQEIRLPLNDFAKSDGTRLNLLTHKVQEILVQCFKPNMRSANFG